MPAQYKDEPIGEAAGVKMPVVGELERFAIDVPQPFLDQTTEKLRLTRLPDNTVTFPPGEEWSDGTPNDVLQGLVDYWLSGRFNWREQERRLNDPVEGLGEHWRLPVEVPGGFGVMKVHFVIKRSGRKGAAPLLLCHGWPGSFYEFHKIVKLLTDPEDQTQQAFHVIIPSIPGYAFSTSPPIPGFGFPQIAYVYHVLMHTLGFKHYLVHGGDWGYMILRNLSLLYPQSVRGVHTTLPVAPPPTLLTHPIQFLSLVAGYMTNGTIGLSQRDIQGLKRVEEYTSKGNGYFKQQSTLPAALAVGLGDSPVGLAAWIREKLHSWTDAYPWTEEEVWMWVMMYWIPGPLGGMRLYKEGAVRTKEMKSSRMLNGWSPVKLGVSKFPQELVNMPAQWMANLQPVMFVKYHESGGHFAAWEKPVELAQDLRDFFGPIVAEEQNLLNPA